MLDLIYSSCFLIAGYMKGSDSTERRFNKLYVDVRNNMSYIKLSDSLSIPVHTAFLHKNQLDQLKVFDQDKNEIAIKSYSLGYRDSFFAVFCPNLPIGTDHVVIYTADAVSTVYGLDLISGSWWANAVNDLFKISDKASSTAVNVATSPLTPSTSKLPTD
jgi:hypothetical protein